VTNGILPSIASVHRAEDVSSAGDPSGVAVGVIAAETTTNFGDDGNGDGDDGRDEDSGDGDDNDGDDANAGLGVTDVFTNEDAAPTDAVDMDDVLPPPSTGEHFLAYMIPPMAFRNVAVFAGCSRKDSFASDRVAVPPGQDGGHAQDTTLFTAHQAEGGAYIMGWVPCTWIAWLATPHPPSRPSASEFGEQTSS
jgi:hypothetical protein